MHSEKSPSGILYIVATPIGNLEDMSARAIRTLKEVDLIACEDTRHTRKLLTHFSIATALTSHYRERESQQAAQLLEQLLRGRHIAVVSDAGTPGISDPGARLVRLARQHGIRIVPIPGPSALSTALSVAGLDGSTFFFGGFPPGKRKARRDFLKGLAALPCPLVFYEAPHRIGACLQDCLEILGNREALLFRELTKIHEECLTGPLTTILPRGQAGVRGEMVLIISGCSREEEDRPDNLDELILWYRQQGDCSLRDCVRRIAVDLDLPRSRVYQRALALWHQDVDTSP